MKAKRYIAILLALLIASLLGTSLIQAQSTVTIIPSQITVAGSKGEVVTRTLLLQSSQPITNIQVITLDLPSTNGSTVLPASAIHLSVPSNSVAAHEPMTLTATVNMGDVSSGEFQGTLFMSYHEGQLTVPLTVKVKDRWPLPLVTLLFGISMAVGISYYRTKVKPRDEVLVRVGQVQAQMKKDAELATPFRAAVESALVDVETALQTQKWEEAQAAMDKAEEYWNRWRRHRRDWLAQISYYDELLAEIEKSDPAKSSVYMGTIRRGVMDAARTITDGETPEPLRQKLAEASQQINRYHTLKAQIDMVGQTAGDLEQAQAAIWNKQATSWKNQLDGLDPANEAAYEELKRSLSEGMAQLADVVAQTAAEKGVRGDGAKGLLQMSDAPVNLLGAVPILVDVGDEGQMVAAGRNLQIFALLSYAVAVGLLAGVGFAELYVARPDFGANAWGDYFALLAWGFGAEASRGAVVEMIRGWGVQ